MGSAIVLPMAWAQIDDARLLELADRAERCTSAEAHAAAMREAIGRALPALNVYDAELADRLRDATKVVAGAELLVRLEEYKRTVHTLNAENRELMLRLKEVSDDLDRARTEIKDRDAAGNK